MRAETIAVNLRRIRQARDRPQADVAAAAGLSRAAYRNIEMSRSTPRGATLQALAEALDVSLGELVAPALVLRRVRFRSQKQMKRREAVLAEVASRLADYNDLEKLLGQRIEPRLPRVKAKDPVRLARLTRSAFGLTDKEPVRDVSGLLEARGVKVLPVDVASEGFFGLSVAPEDGGPAVVVNTWSRISVERWIFTAAHELGHLLLHRDEYDVSKATEEKRCEVDADRFAAHFLMPEGAFHGEWEDTYGMPFVDRVLKVKRIFRVSYRTVLRRLVDSGQVTKEIWPRFQVAYERRFGRTLSGHVEPEGLRPVDFMGERLLQLVRHAVEKDEISLSRAAEILQIPLSEMRDLSASWLS